MDKGYGTSIDSKQLTWFNLLTEGMAKQVRELVVRAGKKGAKSDHCFKFLSFFQIIQELP